MTEKTPAEGASCTLWTKPRSEWDPILSEITKQALKQFRDEFQRRLDMTPIEKVAESIVTFLRPDEDEIITLGNIAAVVCIMQRDFKKEVPEANSSDYDSRDHFKAYRRDGYNQCRRDIGLRDKEETEV